MLRLFGCIWMKLSNWENISYGVKSKQVNISIADNNVDNDDNNNDEGNDDKHEDAEDDVDDKDVLSNDTCIYKTTQSINGCKLFPQ